jgi:hypothetical protein
MIIETLYGWRDHVNHNGKEKMIYRIHIVGFEHEPQISYDLFDPLSGQLDPGIPEAEINVPQP